jgi:hypothetical protein
MKGVSANTPIPTTPVSSLNPLAEKDPLATRMRGFANPVRFFVKKRENLAEQLRQGERASFF